MIIGITGTRGGMTGPQREQLPFVVSALPERLIHGGAVGVDETVDSFVAPLYRDRFSSYIEVYPGSLDRHAYWCDPNRTFRDIRHVWAVTDPLRRNRAIVSKSDHLLAFPATVEEQLRSGTWATIRYARAAGKPITIVRPDGVIVSETGR